MPKPWVSYTDNKQTEIPISPRGPQERCKHISLINNNELSVINKDLKPEIQIHSKRAIDLRENLNK